MIELISLFEKLNSPRRGWLKRGIAKSEAETISEHMYQMAMILMAYPWEHEADRMAAIEMAVVHDAPEAIAGDVIPADNISPETKRMREELGLEYLACVARESNNHAFADRICQLWNEFEEETTPIARVVSQVDTFQALSQAYLYARRYPLLSHKLADFKKYRPEITDPWLCKQADDILQAWETADIRHKSDMVFIFVLGGPGVGKGTQCERAAEKFGLKHISIGDLLRRERNRSDSVYKEFIGRSFKENVPVPPTLAMKLINTELQRLEAEGNSTRGMILDAFPLTKDQLTAFEEEVSLRYSTIIMDCRPEVLLQRLANRAVSSSREDDSAEGIKKRVENFEKSSTETLLQRLARNSLHRIDCAGSIDEVQAAFQSIIERACLPTGIPSKKLH
ncbi:hypothetical protein VTI74DRAFT_8567 [Chaetomium olivicolor]